MSTDMEYTTLGETGLEISRFALGCMNFGSGEPWMIGDEDRSREIIHETLDMGINFLDTANVYSGGESEEIVGRAIEAYDRSKLVLATKVYHRMSEGPNGTGLSRKHVLDQARASLERLGTDYVDLYQIHRWDDDTPVHEVLSALDYLVDEGLVRYVGASTMPAWKFTRALYAADVENVERFVSMQPEYNAVDRHEEANVLPVCAAEGIGVLPWSPLAGGFLTGKYTRSEGERSEPSDPASGQAASDGGRRADTDDYTARRFTEENWAVLDEIRAVADAKGATPAQVSLAWLLGKDVVDAPIIGPRRLDHLEENVGALEISLTDEETARIEEPITPRWPAPGKDT